MKKKTIKLSDEKALELYKTADSTLKQILEETWGYEFFNQNITDKIKTMKDVLDYLNIDRLEDVLPYPKPKDKFEVSINGFVKIKLIAKVLNEGWQENFSDTSEYKYYPWFKKENSGWVFCCWVFDCSDASCSSGCYFKSSKLAKYAGKQFLKEYIEYLPL